MNTLYTNGTDRWLSPPDLVATLGPFDLDPCCEPWMPWRTAVTMLSLAPIYDSIVSGHPSFATGFQSSKIVKNGLTEPWTGRVWMNHPYSMGLPWAEKMAAHGKGIALTAAKSTDTRWGQIFLENCSLVLFLAGRILFHYPDGSKSEGKRLSNALWAFGEEDADRLRRLVIETKYKGTFMRRENDSK